MPVSVWEREVPYPGYDLYCGAAFVVQKKAGDLKCVADLDANLLDGTGFLTHVDRCFFIISRKFVDE